jgi:hypothetical protein
MAVHGIAHGAAPVPLPPAATSAAKPAVQPKPPSPPAGQNPAPVAQSASTGKHVNITA